MRLHVVGISPVENRKFGKKKELEPGQARINTLRVRVWSKEEADKLTLEDVCAPAEEGKIEVLWHDKETIDKWERWVRDHPDHELVEQD